MDEGYMGKIVAYVLFSEVYSFKTLLLFEIQCMLYYTVLLRYEFDLLCNVSFKKNHTRMWWNY